MKKKKKKKGGRGVKSYASPPFAKSKTKPLSHPQKPEILAPAGSEEGFMAAINHGADSVYFGIGALNARAYSKNFTPALATALIQEAHKNNVKAYAAMNSLMLEKEIAETVKTLSILYEAKVDALIVQDMGIWRLCKKYFPDLKLHASTLMNIHNSAGVKQAERMGFKRVVLAREMTLREIEQAVNNTEAEIEIFIHGAMCFTYSGLCMFSSFYGGRSSTRGRCVQPCRRRFIWNGKPGAFFSMNDLNTLSLLPKLVKTGVTSLKIEGRLKPAHYIASVVKAYRMTLDADESHIEEAIKEGQRMIDAAMGRPTSSGYFLNSNPPEALCPVRAANTGLFIGKIVKQGENHLTLKGNYMPESGDRLRYVIPEIDFQHSFTCSQAKQSVEGQFQIDLDEKTAKNLSTAYINEKKPGVTQNQPLLFKTDVARSKLLYKMNLKIPGLNNNELAPILKKAEKKTDEIISEIKREKHLERERKINIDKALNRSKGPEIWLKSDRLERLNFLDKIEAKLIILDINSSNLKTFNLGELKREKRKIVWALPVIINEPDLKHINSKIKELLNLGQRSFMVSNIGHLDIIFQASRQGRKKHGGLHIYGGRELNILNSISFRAFISTGVNHLQFSTESDIENIIKAGISQTFFTVFTYIPLFTSRIKHSSFNIRKEVESLRGEKYHWHQSGRTGRLISSRPFSLLNRRKKLQKAEFRAWLIDLSIWPNTRKLPRRKPQNLNELSRLLSGKDFNFFDGIK